MARIASGKYKQSALKVPYGEVRPTQRLYRLAVFNFLSEYIENASILDLFAGSGSFGIEALSRGARRVVFVDIAAKAIAAIKENIQSIGIKDKAVVYQDDILAFLVKSIRKNRRFDIIFIDPPFTKLYKMKKEERDSYLLEIMDRAKSLLNPQSLVIMKHPKKFSIPVPTGLVVVEERNYGINKASYLAQEDYIVKD